MRLSLELYVDEDADFPDWEKVGGILVNWSRQYSITLPEDLHNKLTDIPIRIETGLSEEDILTVMGALTDSLYDSGINIEIQRL